MTANFFKNSWAEFPFGVSWKYWDFQSAVSLLRLGIYSAVKSSFPILYLFSVPPMFNK